MFSIFKKAPDEDESIFICGFLAHKAEIDLLYRDGVPLFLIKVDHVKGKIAPHIKCRKALHAFVERVESRIAEEFPSSQAEDLGLPVELLEDSTEDITFCERLAVSDSEKRGLFKWSFTKDSRLLIECI
jgi:hypothetical protein